MNWLYNLKIKNKIYLVAFISILGFATYLVYNYFIAQENETRLHNIQNIEYPTLQNINASIDLLKQVRSIYLEAINEADIDLLEEISNPADSFHLQINLISRRLPTLKADTDIIQLSFKSYIQSANTITNNIISKSLPTSEIQTAVPQMQEFYQGIESKLISFKNQINKSFFSSLGKARSDAQNSWRLGLILGLISLFVAILISYLISRKIGIDLSYAVNIAKSIAEGHREINIAKTSNDETGTLLSSIDEMRHKLQEREALITGLVETAVDGIVAIDEQQKIIMYNAAAEELFGYSAEEVLGKNLTVILPSELHDQHITFINAHLQTGKKKIIGGTRELQAVRRNGEYFPITLSLGAVKTSKGTVFPANIRDISEQKSFEHELSDTRDKALEAAKLKAAFLANMSHEIRTPMNGVLGMVQILSQTQLTDQQQTYLTTIKESGNVLLNVINDILDFSKLDADKVVLENIPFNLEHMASDVCRILLPDAAKKDLELILHYDINCPRRVSGDPRRLQQILINLVGNAIKFTQTGYVEVNIELIISETIAHQSMAEIKFRVTDTGIGINPHAQETLFSAFTQVDSTTTRQYGGTGLGLAICRQLVEKMGGQISIDSELGEGSSFCFSITMPIVEEAAIFPSINLANTKVLVVDDLELNCQILQKFLTHTGMSVISTQTGEEALRVIKSKQQSNSPFQLVIIDYFMPQMNGMQLAKEIREIYDKNTLPLILFTSNFQDTDYKQVEDHGFNGYIPKPIQTEVLLNTISATLAAKGRNDDKLITPLASKKSEWQPENQNVLLQGHVLIVEDVDANTMVIFNMLTNLGISAETTANGEEALQYIKDHDFDLILMDCHMPIMDGFTATKLIREQELGSNKHIPIIALTANVMTDNQQICKDAGMDDFLAKPIVHSQLVNKLNIWLSKNYKIKNPAPIATPKVNCDQSKNQELLDFQRVDLLNSMMKDNFAEMILSFDKGTLNYIESLRNALRDHDRDAFVFAAHSLKGLCGNIGAIKVQELAAQIEIECKAGLQENLNLKIQELKVSIANTTKQLKEYAA